MQGDVFFKVIFPFTMFLKRDHREMGQVQLLEVKKPKLPIPAQKPVMVITVNNSAGGSFWGSIKMDILE